MATTTCKNCENSYIWRWEEAFDKFGFNDGDGQVQTFDVVDVLQTHGYEVEYIEWVLHNTVIHSVKKDDHELIAESVDVGYDNPRNYLPEEIVELLDKAFL